MHRYVIAIYKCIYIHVEEELSAVHLAGEPVDHVSDSFKHSGNAGVECHPVRRILRILS